MPKTPENLSARPPVRGSRLGAVSLVLCLAGVMLSAADGAGTRVLLLLAGPRASIVIELDEEPPQATAIEATDNQSVAVEIGPIRGKVVNQLLDAAQDSPLVRQVRVRGVTQGADGTVITIQVTAKAPVSGSVRRAQRRIYIDLQPLDARVVGPQPPDRVAATETPKPTQTSGVATPVRTIPAAAPPPVVKSAVPAAKPAVPVAVPAKIAAPAPAPTRAAAPPTAAATSPSDIPVNPALQVAAATVKPAAVPPPNPPPAAADPVLPRPAPATGAYNAAAAPMTSTPSVRQVTGPAGSIEDAQHQAEQLVKAPDVKGLERLKTDLQAKRATAAASGAPTAAVDALLTRFDQYIIDAQRNQLAADASLFRSGGDAGGNGSVAEFQQALRPLKPELESVSNALRGWSGGALPPANLQSTVASLLPRLRSLKPPSTMLSAHSGMCEALDALALMWAKAAVEPPPEGSESVVIDRARQAVDDFLRLERGLAAPSNAAR